MRLPRVRFYSDRKLRGAIIDLTRCGPPSANLVARGETLLHIIVALQNEILLAEFLAREKSVREIDVENHAGTTPLHVAILKGKFSEIE